MPAAKKRGKKRWFEDMQCQFGQGTFDRIEAVIQPDENRTDFVRKAVDVELRRREADQSKQNPRGRRA